MNVLIYVNLCILEWGCSATVSSLLVIFYIKRREDRTSVTDKWHGMAWDGFVDGLLKKQCDNVAVVGCIIKHLWFAKYSLQFGPKLQGVAAPKCVLTVMGWRTTIVAIPKSMKWHRFRQFTDSDYCRYVALAFVIRNVIVCNLLATTNRPSSQQATNKSATGQPSNQPTSQHFIVNYYYCRRWRSETSLSRSMIFLSSNQQLEITVNFS